ncbi:MAG: serine hydrolase [Muricoprocola sp.]
MKWKKTKCLGFLMMCIGALSMQADVSAGKEDTKIEKAAESEAKADENEEKLSGLMKELEEQLPEDNGNWSVYVCDLKSGEEAAIESRPMQSASLIKLYIMGAVYENYEELAEIYGEDTLYNNLFPMITVSDNDSANYLTECLGKGNTDEGMRIVTEFCKKHGYQDSGMGRLLLHSNEFGDNYTSVTDAGHFLKEIYESIHGEEEKELAHTEEMFDLLSQQQTRYKIPSRLPEDVKVANKTGELSDVENDAAILYDTLEENDLVIVFMSDSLKDVYQAHDTIGTLSRYIYDYYNKGGAVG